MFIYVGKTFTATASGRRLVSIVCPKCRTEYAYELVRMATGQGTAPYYIGQAAAQQRAQRGAEKSLAKRLAQEAELVACPKCHWVDEQQIAKYRKMHYGWVLGIGCILVIIAAIVALVMVLNLPRSEQQMPAAILGLLIVATLLAAVLLLQRMLRNRIDPNCSYPRRPSLPIGSPPALLPKLNPATGQKTYVPVMPQQDAATQEWVVFRPGELVFPDVCCECLAPAEDVYSTPFKMNERSDLSVPLCHSCLSRLRRRWWGLLGKVLAASGLVASMSFLITGIDKGGQWLFFVMTFCALSLAGFLTICQWGVRPYRVKIVDARRNIGAIRFRNAQYTAKIREMLRPREITVNWSHERLAG